MLLLYIRAVAIVAIFSEAVGHSHFEFIFRRRWRREASMAGLEVFMCVLLEVGGCKYCIFMYLIYVIVWEGEGRKYLCYFDFFV
jgi:hypothetical protein